MSNPNGNPGNKGGGRKSAYEEFANAEFLADVFFNEHDVDELQQKLRSKKFSVAKMLLMKALSGNDKVMIEIFKKLFPDKNIQINPREKDINEALESIKEIISDGHQQQDTKVIQAVQGERGTGESVTGSTQDSGVDSKTADSEQSKE